MAVIFDAQNSSNLLEERLKTELKSLPKLNLASVALGGDSSSGIYRSSQKRLAQTLGVKYHSIDLDTDISFEVFSSEIKKLNTDPKITGIIINKPFPSGWQEEEVFALLDVNKDIEGVHPANLGKLFMGSKAISDLLDTSAADLCISPTVRSILHALSLSGSVNVRGKRAVVVGFSSLIGKPLVFLLANALATVSITHIATSEAGDLPEYIKNADIVITAVGIPELIKGDWIKPGAILIDVGTAKEDGKLTGDVEFEAALENASFITPVPGGVGKLTPLFLYNNLVLAAKKQKNL